MTLQNVLGDLALDASVQAVLAQVEAGVRAVQGAIPDAGNTTIRTAANGASAYQGAWTPTNSQHVVRVLTVVASNVVAGLGGTFVFEFSNDAVANNGISETRVIGDFRTVVPFDLFNAGAYYRVTWTPSRALTGSEIVAVTTTLSTQYAGPFVRLATQQIDQRWAAMPETFAFLQAFNAETGLSENVPPPAKSVTDTDNQMSTPLAAAQVYTGVWKEVEQHGNLIYLYAINNTDIPASVVVEYSNDQATVVSSTALTRQDVTVAPGLTYAVYLLIANGNYAGKYARPKVTAAAAQTNTPVTVFTRNQFPFNGTFSGLNAPLTFFSQALLTRAVLAANTPAGGFVNIYGTAEGALMVKQDGVTVTPGGALFNQGFVPHVRHEFGTTSSTASVANLRKTTVGAASGITADTTNGGAVFATDAAAGSRCLALSQFVIPYSENPGHGIQSDITLFREPGSIVIDGDAYVEWGLCDVGGPDNGFGYGKDATGLYVFLRKLGNNTIKVYQPNWAIDPCLGDALSRFRRGGAAEALSFDKDNLFRVQSEFLYAAEQRFIVKTPHGAHIDVHVNEYPNTATATSLRDANLYTFVDVHNRSDTGGVLKVRSGSWVGGVFSNQTVMVVRKADGSYTVVQEPPADNTGVPTAHITKVDDDLLLRGLPTSQVRQIQVGTTPVRLDPNPLPNRRFAAAHNLDESSTPLTLWLGHDANIAADSASWPVYGKGSSGGAYGPQQQLWGVLRNTGGVQTVLNRTGSASGGTGTTPANALTSDNSYCSLTSGQTVDVSGFTAGTANPLVSVKLCVEGSKQAGQVEQVTFLDAVTGNAGNVGAVSTSLNVTASAQTAYLAYVSRESAAAVTAVTGLGLAWTLAQTEPSDDAHRTLDAWVAYGSPTVSGIVTASFALAATGSHIAVLRFSGASSSPVQATSVGAANSTAVTTAALAGTAKGLAVLGVAKASATATPGAGYTERSDEQATDGLATETKQLVATGNETPAMTLSAAKHYAAVAVTLAPAAAYDPIVTLSYKLSGVLQATSGQATMPAVDGVLKVDVTGDRAWVAGDAVNVDIIATGTSVTAAAAQIDQLYLELTDTTAAVVRVSLREIA